MNEFPATTIVPSLPANTLDQLLTLGEQLQGVASGFQVDLVDGQFVSAQSWPFTEAGEVGAALCELTAFTKQFSVSMDCMITDPQQYFEIFKTIGVERVIIHYGSTDLVAAITAARQCGFVVGIGVMNDTPLAEITTLLVAVDFVQVMGIATIGAQGQPFDERTVETVRSLRMQYPTLEIAVDGSVNQDTIPVLQAAGVNRFAPGSAVSQAADPAAAFVELAALAGLQQVVN